MRKTTTYTVLLISALGLISFAPMINRVDSKYVELPEDIFGGSAPAAKTGAPGEGSCVDCHSGSTLPASGVVSFSFSGANNLYVPGQSYDITISLTGSVKTGFQMTALDDNDSAAGDFTAGTNSQTQSNAGKNYINHSASSGVDSWTFLWNAPSVSAGDVTFYYAVNETNNNGNNQGDQIYIGSNSISEDVSSGIATISDKEETVIDMIVQNNSLMTSFSLEEDANIYFAAQDISGKQLDYHNFGQMNAGLQSFNIPLDSKYSSGIYLFTVFVNNTPYTTKIALP